MFRSRGSLLGLVWMLVFLALIANAMAGFYSVSILIDNDRWVAHTHQTKESIAALLATLTDTETRVRGYVITGEPIQVKMVEELNAKADLELADFIRLTRDNPRQQEEAQVVRKLIEAQREIQNTIIAAIRGGNSELAAEQIRNGSSRASMERIRRQFESLNAYEDDLLAQRRVIATESYRRSIATGIVGTFLSLSIAAAAFFVVRSELKRRHSAETALKTEMEENRIASERFRLLTETVPVHIWMSEPHGKAMLLNRSWQDFTGIADDPEGRSRWTSAFHPDDSSRLDAVWKMNDGGSNDLYQTEIRVRRGIDRQYRWHRCYVVPIRNHSGKLLNWVGMLSDIQDQKDQTESLEQAVQLRTQELRRINNVLQEEIVERSRAEDRANLNAEELRRSNSELEKFAYVASHDLQEPLRKIQAFGDRLLRKCRDQLDDTGKGYLDRMLVSSGRMRTLIDDLLSFSRAASVQRPYVAVDLNLILTGVVADLEATLAQSNGRIEGGPLPTITADPLQMRQLFQNLLGNALKFGKPDVPPTVKVEAVNLSDVPPSTDPPPPFAGWRLTFTDQGIGFEQEHAGRIFELFQRLHGRDRYEGTGIGLAICRKIVERHGGTICARSQPGVGTTFIVDLPETPPDPLALSP